MNPIKDSHDFSVSHIAPEPVKAMAGSQPTRFKKLCGGLLAGLGFMLSPLCWWNDLVFNLPIAYGFGYVCSLISPNWLMPGAITGYWLSNLAGILLMQFGILDMAENRDTQRNFMKDILMGVATSTVYTLIILVVVQFKWVDLAAIIPGEFSLAKFP